MTNEDFWNYSLRLYKRDRVRKVCLELQDRFRADVNILLFLCYRAAHGMPAPRLHDLAAMVESIRTVRKIAIEPLRALRRRLKTPMTEDIPELREALRQRVLEAEIAGEALVQGILERRFPVCAGTADSGREELTTQAITRYLELIGMPLASTKRAARELAAAAS